MSVPETGYQLDTTGQQTDEILARAAAGGEIDMAIAAKAPLNSPAFTGTPTAPTPSASDNSTKVATTAFVNTVFGNKTPVRVVDYDATGDSWNVWVAYINGGFSLILRVANPDENSYYHYYSLVNYAHYTEDGASVYEMIFERVDGNVIDQRTLKRTVNGGISTFEWTQNTTNIKDIDDALSETSENPVQNKVITEALYNSLATDSASGDIASFPDGADDIPVKSLIAQITPLQSGTGDPAPDNIRPISGWTGMKISVDGVNVWDEEWEVGNIDNSTGGNTSTQGYIRSKNYSPCKPSTSYCAKAPVADSMRVFWYDNNQNYINSESVPQNNSVVLTSPDNAYFFRLKTYASAYQNDISINYPSTDTSYHAYNGSTVNIDWTDEAGTVYGGTLTYINGGKYSLQATKASKDLGTLDWDYYSSGNRFVNSNTNPAIKRPINDDTPAEILSSHLKVMALSALRSSASDNLIAVGDTGSISVRYTASGTDAAAFKTAMNGVQFVYELAVYPDPIILDAEDVKTLLGDNNIFTDCSSEADAVNVVYRCDTALYIDKKLAEA